MMLTGKLGSTNVIIYNVQYIIYDTQIDLFIFIKIDTYKLFNFF